MRVVLKNLVCRHTTQRYILYTAVSWPFADVTDLFDSINLNVDSQFL
ncbi:hypothetical protein SAMN05192552_104223 [Natrinema hispanicum]|uniref:Uncharacterized protein n=1 Tax=Natrinema hispanicum TaxID=392421 RepID=A0A1I0JCX3_9EURY|nr:hypothetical protein SAMN05192552_104223 [Natrinema hispanicum]SEU07253.1 hypothetical protein SAMN04488694_1377 [Natrinema hispanicum]